MDDADVTRTFDELTQSNHKTADVLREFVGDARLAKGAHALTEISSGWWCPRNVAQLRAWEQIVRTANPCDVRSGLVEQGAGWARSE